MKRNPKLENWKIFKSRMRERNERRGEHDDEKYLCEISKIVPDRENLIICIGKI